mgnify:CR=1 FL=1
MRPGVQIKDGNKENIVIDNLELITRKNIYDENCSSLKGETHPLSKLTNAQATEIFNLIETTNKTNAEIAEEWAKSTDAEEFTLSAKPKEGETEIEALRRKSVAVLEKGEDGDGKIGGKKYILLRSQIDSFDQLNTNLKDRKSVV